jgi:hypothetical protein
VPIVRVRISIDVAGIRAGFARERPPVDDDEWDAMAYVDERIAAYREALRALSLADEGLSLQVVFDAGGAAGDRLMISTAGFAGADVPATVVQSIADAVRPVTGDTGGWRRHLRTGYFERHRAWRRETGSPIAH